MSDTFNQELVPLVEHYRALGEKKKLSPADIKTYATELERIFHTMDSPARHIRPWGYTPDFADSDENTLGNSGIDPFPANKLVSPTSEDEIIAIVKKANASRSQVRVIGAAHSSPSNIILDAPHGVFPNNVVLITLTKYRGVSIDKTTNRATVKAGTNLDVDPQVPDSTPANSLANQLQNAGFALPETGGITHQTIGGFLSTGMHIVHLLNPSPCIFIRIPRIRRRFALVQLPRRCIWFYAHRRHWNQACTLTRGSRSHPLLCCWGLRRTLWHHHGGHDHPGADVLRHGYPAVVLDPTPQP
jgi:hypothetical protein